MITASPDPYRQWRLEVSPSSGESLPLENELNLLPPAEAYSFRALFKKNLLTDGGEGFRLSVEQDKGSAFSLRAWPQGGTIAESSFLEGELLVADSERSPGKVHAEIPSQGSLCTIGVNIQQVLSAQRRIEDQEETDAVVLELIVNVQDSIEKKMLFPTLAEGNLEGGAILGFDVGQYPDPAGPLAKPVVKAHPEKYQPPECFYRVDRDTAALKISPHFMLGQFDMDFDSLPGQFPQYIALDLKLVEKLERLLERMKHAGYTITTFEILSGFRSPKFNEEYKRADPEFSLSEPYSQHLYGRAADFIVDEDHNGCMDDLNQDGKIDIEDARVILEFVDKIDREALEGWNTLLGGAGVYSRHDIPDREVQTPYVHIDTRGFADKRRRPIRWVGKE